MVSKLSFLGRIVYTILSLEVLFFFYNFVVQSILLFPGPLYDMENKFFKSIFFVLYFLFVIFSPIVLIIPTYEFISFPYLFYNDPYCHLKSFKYIGTNIKYEEEQYNIIDDNFNKNFMDWGFLFFAFFLLGLFTDAFSDFKDLMEFWCLISNFIHYIKIFFCYFLFSIINMEQIISGEIRYYDKKSYPSINLLSYIIFKNNENNELNNYDLILFFLRELMILLSIIGIIYLFITKLLTLSLTSILFIFIYVIKLELSFALNFRTEYFSLSKKKNGKEGNKNNGIKVNISLFISFIFSFGIIISFLLINIFIDDKEATINKFKDIQLIQNKVNKSLTFHNFCHAKLYDIPIYLYQPFINDAYYYNNGRNFSSFNYNNYSQLLFGKNYEVKVIGNLTNDNSTKNAKMVQYFIKNKNNNNNVTILSIKGTSYKRDIYLDAQLYFPSLILNILNTFSNLDQQKETASFSLIEYAFSIPYRIFFQFSIIDNYIEDLNSAFYNFINISKNHDENIVFVGHSLGGGLAKILGKLVGRQAISLSGPGINAFHSLWKSKGKNKFELTAIDIIPDLDIVPRVDISGGTIYRLLCLKSPFKCHSKELSLCEPLIICKNPYAKEYCKTIAKLDERDIKEIENNSEFS